MPRKGEKRNAYTARDPVEEGREEMDLKWQKGLEKLAVLMGYPKKPPRLLTSRPRAFLQEGSSARQKYSTGTRKQSRLDGIVSLLKKNPGIPSSAIFNLFTTTEKMSLQAFQSLLRRMVKAGTIQTSKNLIAYEDETGRIRHHLLFYPHGMEVKE